MTTGEQDRFAPARAVADAILYEGYVLYPYRASSKKNQLRWQFGVLVPADSRDEESSDRSFCRTECLVATGRSPLLRVRVRFLQLQRRLVESTEDQKRYVEVDTLKVGNDIFCQWDEAVERSVDLPPLRLDREDPISELDFLFESGSECEPIVAPDGAIKGRLRRERQAVSGRILLRSEPLSGNEGLRRLSVRVDNTTEVRETELSRQEVTHHSLVGLHTMLAIEGGSFVSLLEPPPGASKAAASCRSEGTYPVLVGADDVVLSSPIILYDHPEVAPESPGDLYDSTEIDEILALRVLTLTDDEKAEARGTDPRSAAVIDRCDSMPPEIWERLHGAMRSLEEGAPGGGSVGDQFGEASGDLAWWDPAADATVDPWSDSVLIAGDKVQKGTPVVLRPSRRADAQDLFFAGKEATVTGVFKDVDGAVHVAVSVDDDPANSELDWQGRYLFFHPEEIEPLGTSQARQ